MGQEAESGIHWEFHQMLAEGDAPSLWMLSEAEWFLNNNFFFDSTRRVDLSVAEKSKYEIGWRLRSSPSRSEIERLPYVSMIVGDVNGEEWLLSEVWNGFEKIIIILYIVEIWNHMTWELVKLFNGRIAIVIIWETVQHDLVGIFRLVKRILLRCSEVKSHVAWWFSRDAPAVRMGDPEIKWNPLLSKEMEIAIRRFWWVYVFIKNNYFLGILGRYTK